MAKFKVKTSAPKGRNTWESGTLSMVQDDLFALAAMLASVSADAEAKLMKAVADAKAKKMALTA